MNNRRYQNEPFKYQPMLVDFRRYKASGNEVVQTMTEDLYGSHGSFKEHLFDERWKNKRNEILKRDRHRCAACGSKKGLQVHHRVYHFNMGTGKFNLPWEYDSPLLITFCKYCNQNGHNQFKVPIKSV